MKTIDENDHICPICFRKGADTYIPKVDRITIYGLNETDEYAHDKCLYFTTISQNLSIQEN